MDQEEALRDSRPCCCGAEHFTERELSVLRLVAEGLRNKEIADSLHISTHTVDRYVSAMLRRSGARNRASLVDVAYFEGILIPGAHPPALSTRRCLQSRLTGPGPS